MLILRIRQAECAIADGRLDEAVALAERHDVQSHRRGQRMLKRLVNALVDRAEKHLNSDRPADAAADAEKARRFGGLMPEVSELRSKAAEALMAKHRAERREARLVAAAREQIDRGNLTTGQKLLADPDIAESAAGVMLRDVHVRREALTTAIDNAEAALDRDDWEAALRQLARAHGADASADPAFDGIVARLGETVHPQVRAALNVGDLPLASRMLDRLSAIDGRGVGTRQLCDVIAQCRLAWDCIERGQIRQAEQVVRRLSTLLPSAKWIGEVAKHLHQASESLDELRASPLGLCGVGSNHPSPDVTIAEPPAERRVRPNYPSKPATTPAAPKSPSLAGDAMPSRFLLQLDGAGSFLIVTSPVITIGPVSSSVVPDVGLMTDASAAIARVERVEEDYFLRANGPVVVNGKPCAGKLLNAGDEIALSPRCRFAFRQPSAASTSAVLDLTGARCPRGDVRRVILLDRELVVGPGVGAHVRIDELTEKLVLVMRDGRLFAQTQQPVLFAGRDVAPRVAAVPVDTHVKAGTVSFVVTHV